MVGSGVLRKKRLHVHNLPGGAEPALVGVFFEEGLLHGSEFLAVHQAFHGGDLRARRLPPPGSCRHSAPRRR